MSKILLLDSDKSQLLTPWPVFVENMDHQNAPGERRQISKLFILNSILLTLKGKVI